jgi:two-component sensor histidine kinase
MRTRASVHGSVGESVDISSIMPAMGGAWTSSRDDSLGAIPRLAAKPSEIDADLYLFALCKHLQTICLDRRGIGFILDADGAGRLPETVCRMLGLMVCELVNDAAECTYPETAQENVRVTLRRRGTTCVCTISHRCAESRACARRGLERAQQLASQLSDRCVVRSMPDGRISAIRFDIDLVERCFAAPTWLYRTEDVSTVAAE